MFYFPHLWIFYPALLYGLSFLLGIGFAMTYAWWMIFPALALWLPAWGYINSYKEEMVYSRIILSVVTAISGFFFFTLKHDLPKIPFSGIHGEGVFEIDNLSAKSHFFGKSWQYRGNLSSFNVNGVALGHNIPVFITIPFKKGVIHPPADGLYVIKGKLKQSDRGTYSLSVNHNDPWKRVEGTWSLAELRYKSKKWVKSYIESNITSMRSSKFLIGMATGEFDDRLMAFEFSRFGLQHLMAISGFHFGIIAYFLSLLARLVLPPKWCPWVLIVGLSLYFLFLGVTASVMRSWIGAMVFFVGQLLEKESNGLNVLGIGLLVILALDPLSAGQMGFQFSFATTAAILLFYNPSLAILNRYFPKRKLGNVLQMDIYTQHAYVILHFFKTAFALTMAVSIVAIPMTIFYFYKFPLMSIVFNLFYPFLASISMLLFMLGVLLAWVPPISYLVHAFNAVYTDFILDFTYGLPTHYDIYINYYDLSAWVLVLYITTVFFGGLAWKHYKKEELSWYGPLP